MEKKRLIDNSELLFYDVSLDDMVFITDVSASGGIGVDKKISVSSMSGLFCLPLQTQVETIKVSSSAATSSITSSLNSITSQIQNLGLEDVSLSGRIYRLELGAVQQIVVSRDFYPVGYNDSLSSIIGYLSQGGVMFGPTTLILIDNQLITETIGINLEYPLIITSGGYGQISISANTGLAGKPMFSVSSDVGFNKLLFNGSSLPGYGQSANENAIELCSDDIYVEYKDCGLSGFNTGIMVKSNCEAWCLDAVINDCFKSGLEFDIPSGSGAKFRSVAVDYSNSMTGINFIKGQQIIFTSQNDQSELSTSAQCFISKPNNDDVTFEHFILGGLSWNNVGTFKSGFDFSLSSGRDADIEMENNFGQENQNPHVNIVVQSSTAVTNLLSQTCTKANYNVFSTYLKKFSFVDNRLTYLPTHARDTIMWISGTILTTSSVNPIWTTCVGIVKNGNTDNIYGRMQITLDQSNRSFNFSLNAYCGDTVQGDWFELWLYSNSGQTKDVVITDLTWFIESR